jgi:hypothetical protein
MARRPAHLARGAVASCPEEAAGEELLAGDAGEEAGWEDEPDQASDQSAKSSSNSSGSSSSSEQENDGGYGTCSNVDAF